MTTNYRNAKGQFAKKPSDPFPWDALGLVIVLCVSMFCFGGFVVWSILMPPISEQARTDGYNVGYANAKDLYFNKGMAFQKYITAEGLVKSEYDPELYCNTDYCMTFNYGEVKNRIYATGSYVNTTVITCDQYTKRYGL